MNERTRKDTLERFVHKVRLGPGGCWNWTGATVDGYARFWDGTKPNKGYRVAWRLFRGLIPAELEIDHLCRNPACVNPAHLEPVTHRENVRRGLTPIIVGEWNRRKTHCPQGHEYTAENTYVDKKNKRSCRECGRARKRRARKSRCTT